jgi:transposase InsO family protein
MQGLRARQRRRYRCTTETGHGLAIKGNLLARGCAVAHPKTIWVTDLTYLWTLALWLYLAVILDLSSRRVVGWSMSRASRTSARARSNERWRWRIDNYHAD